MRLKEYNIQKYNSKTGAVVAALSLAAFAALADISWKPDVCSGIWTNAADRTDGSGTVKWEFPRLGNCHEGMAFADGKTGDRYYCDDGHGSHHDAVKEGFSRMMGRPKIMQMDGQCAAAAAVMELMVHEINGRPEFFRGCPPEWDDVSFENMRLQDGSRVSGRRKNGIVSVRRDAVR